MHAGPSGNPHAEAERLKRNKESVVAFYEMMFNDCRPAEAIARYAGDRYIQHNPGVADGKQGFIDYFEDAARESALVAKARAAVVLGGDEPGVTHQPDLVDALQLDAHAA